VGNIALKRENKVYKTGDKYKKLLKGDVINNYMKRPGVVWIFSILIILGIIYSVSFSIHNLFIFIGISTLNYVISIISIILVIPFLIFIILFFMLKRSSLIWLYISFGLSILVFLIVKEWISLIVFTVLGLAVWDYIRKKQIGGRNVFT